FKVGGLILEGPPMWTRENRPKFNRHKLLYPSDLTDGEWSHEALCLVRAHHQRDLLGFFDVIDLGGKIQSPQRHAEQEPEPGRDAVAIADARPRLRQVQLDRRISSAVDELVESECGAGGFRPNISVAAPFVWRCLTSSPVLPFPHTGSPEAVARLRFPQNVACGFPAPRSSAIGSQHREALQRPIGKMQFGSR